MVQAAASPGDPSAVAASRRQGHLRAACTIAFLLLLTLLATIIARSLDSVFYSPTSDDGYYLRYMTAINHDGLSVFPSLFQAWNETPRDWLHPPPTRLVYMTASAALSLLLGTEITTLSWVSLLSHLGWTTITWFFARRRMGDVFALALAALCGFSPLMMGLGRVALMDTFACMTVTLALWLFLEALEQPGVRLWRVLFALAFLLALMTKELSVFMAPPLIALVLIERYVRKTPLSLPEFAAAFAVPALVAGPTFILAAGGIGPLLTTTGKVLAAPKTMEYAIQFNSGPWYRYLIDFLCLSPFPTLLGLLSVGSVVDRLRAGAWPRPQVFFLLFGAVLLAEQAPLIKNARYMVALELPLRFLALAWLFHLTAALRTRWRVLLVGAAVVTLCALDWQSFRRDWVKKQGYDPVTYQLMIWRKMIPR
ncbi:MAG: glycosyltransferase family 39 protein [Polyangiaceae bacterium]